MTLLDPKKIIIKHTVNGINCHHCGGKLERHLLKSLMEYIIRFISLGIFFANEYRCVVCKETVVCVWRNR